MFSLLFVYQATTQRNQGRDAQYSQNYRVQIWKIWQMKWRYGMEITWWY